MNDIVRLRCRAMERGLSMGDYCAAVLLESLTQPDPLRPAPPPVPRPAGNDIRDIMRPLASVFLERNPVAAAQMQEMLVAWEKYRESKPEHPLVQQ